MKLANKILKFIYEDSKPTFDKSYQVEDITEELDVEEEKILPALRHLKNIGHINSHNKPGWVGNLDIKDHVINISSKGIIFLEEKNPKKLQTWAPIWISVGALIIAIIALFKNS